jgi:ELWxxDGT repeat protein
MRASLSRPILLLLAPVAAGLLLLQSAAPVTAATHPSSDPSGFTAVGSQVFFAATTGAHGRELWVTDGTAAGTHEVVDINPTPGVGSDPDQLTALGDRVYFFADAGAGLALWKSDGTATGTKPLSGALGKTHWDISLASVSGRLFVTASLGECCTQSKLWTSDGTVRGTRAIATLGYIPSWTNRETHAAAGLGGFYFFFALNGFLNRFLFSADFREDVTHRPRHYIDKFEKEWFMETQCASVANRTTQNAPQNVTATFV